MVIGFQIHAVIDHRTWPWHAARSDTVYFEEPRGNELGLDRMPHPPEESPNLRDRAAGTPQIAYNCRCFLSPVLSPIQSILEQTGTFRFLTGTSDELAASRRLILKVSRIGTSFAPAKTWYRQWPSLLG
jgi:hypothetical protein